VRDQVRNGGAVLLTTHHLDEAEALASRVVLVDRGVVVADASVAELKRSAGRTRVSFRADGGTPVAGSVRDGDFVRILTRDGGATVAALVRDGVTLDDLEVRPATLEEAIAAIGGDGA
jgi:ABC-2 type transport system ATP-binding protein